LTPGEKSERKRMAQVATVYWIEPWPRTAADVVHTLRGPEVETKRPRPIDKRVWASVEKQPRKVIRAAFEEALRRDPDKLRRWIDTIDDSARKQVAKACKYLADRTRTRLMHYEEALQDGLPIATGVVEGACRYLVKDRMDRTGARWGLTSAEAVLRLRAIRSLGDFDAYWQFHLERERARNHASLYDGGNVPDPLPAPKPRLPRVK
jgi:hypothetical protein